MNENCVDDIEILMVDSSKLLVKEGFINLCQQYGSIKNITLHKRNDENQAFIQFEDNDVALKFLNEKFDLPSFIKASISGRTKNKMESLTFKKGNEEDVEKYNADENLKTIIKENRTNETKFGTSIYIGPNVSGRSLIEESKQSKVNNKIIHYNLENDDLFGRPLSTKWEKLKKPEFELNNLDFYYRFENCSGGEIKIEKKLSPNMFTGLTTFFNDGDNIQDKLKIISNDIECSDLLNINNLKYGMLVGAFDSATNLYGRGYVTLVAGNSVNIAMSDYGRVINTTKIRVLPNKHSKSPAYSFKVYTKGDYVPQLKNTSYTFKVRSVGSERIVLIMFDENKEIKVQLKKWQPTVEESGVSYIDFKNNSSVELLKLKDMNSVFIRSKEKHHFEFLFSSWNNLAAYCYKNRRGHQPFLTTQPLNREPLYGEIVGFKSTLTNNYARGRIHKFFGDKIYSVKHMDDPFKENINSSEMIELPFEYKSMPVSFLKVGLQNALPYPIQFDAKYLVVHVIGVRLSVHFDEAKAEGWKYVDLNITLVKENLNSILNSLVEPLWLKDNATIDSIDDIATFTKYMDLSRIELVEKSVVTMKFVVFHDGVFYMRDKFFGKSFSLLSDMIKEYCSLSLNPYLPHIDEVCLGQFPDGMWYRVICDQMKPGELVKVHSVDLGNIAFLSSRNIKKLPEELLFHPTHVALCILNNSIEINEKKIELLEKYENTDCEITIVKSLGGKNHYTFNCPFIEEILQ
ncbi:uncharacterized protein LOC132949399 isoform X3 [Metopolophium dirhodum]|uniref:uncharacterized protein LOC132949399 isoform X3 n=1 Tax=Metopolophium dirhodum TaxID=44670 RepID=UPI00298F7F05|nr:uncharacterized protein LOC132949399 isoform X3 [Metopolophium dirhodum]